MISSKDIKISVKTHFLSEQSQPDSNRYAFAYTIEIFNEGPETVQLLTRYWHIKDDNDKIEEVRGEGVIGLQPEIGPGQTFKYSSGAIIETEIGTMQGSYEMVTESGVSFEAPIEPFLLAPPNTVH